MTGLHPYGCGCRDCRPVGPGMASPWRTFAANLFYTIMTFIILWVIIYLLKELFYV